MLGTLAICSLGWVGVYYGNRERRRQRREMLEARFALYPLFLAEDDRNILKQMKDFEEAELEIMKNIPAWRAGESVYYNTRWIMPVPDNLELP